MAQARRAKITGTVDGKPITSVRAGAHLRLPPQRDLRDLRTNDGRALVAALEGATIKRVEVHEPENGMDPGHSLQGATFHLADGATVELLARWCNDSTADLGVEVF